MSGSSSPRSQGAGMTRSGSIRPTFLMDTARSVTSPASRRGLSGFGWMFLTATGLTSIGPPRERVVTVGLLAPLFYAWNSALRPVNSRRSVLERHDVRVAPHLLGIPKVLGRNHVLIP